MERATDVTDGPLLGWDALFRGSPAELDATVTFYSLARSLAGPRAVILDVGCGRGGAVATGNGQALQDLRAPARRVIGIDVDDAGAQNPVIDEFRFMADPARWPVESDSVDLVVSDWVLEHVAAPEEFVAELRRVLRPGGLFAARTVSAYSPLSLASRLFPNRRHAGVLSRLQPQRQALDVFPTAYRMNSVAALSRLLSAFDWRVLHRGGLHHYLAPWPRLARAVSLVEPRLPGAMRTVLIVVARLR